MKNLIVVLSILLGGTTIKAQTVDLIPNGNLEFFYPFSLDCINCYSNLAFNSGIKYGIGLGLVKEISPRFDLITNLGFGYWNYKVRVEYYGGGGYFDQYDESTALFNLSIGERFHLVEFAKSSIFSGLNFNFQLNTTEFYKKFGVSLEPTIGWRKSFGQKSELFIATGFDQHLTSYTRFSQKKPGRIVFNIGYNFLLKKKQEELPTNQSN